MPAKENTKAGGSKGSPAKTQDTYPTRFEANKAFFALSAEDRADVQVLQDADTGQFYVGPRGG